MKLKLQIDNDPVATEQAEHAPHLHQALKSLGFQQVGLVRARLPEASTHLKPLVAGEDAVRLIEVTETGEAVTVWQNPAHTTPAFAVAERHFDRPVLCFDTITDDGRIVETVMKPDRAPQLGGYMGLENRDVSYTFKLFSKLMGWAVGQPGLWSRPHRPKAGFYVELTATDNPLLLWQRHQQRVADLLNDRPVSPVHDNLSLHLTIGHRALQINEQEQKRLALLDWVIAGPMIFLVCLLPLLGFYAIANPETASAMPFNHLFTTDIKGSIYMVAFLSVCYFFIRGGIRTWLLPHLPLSRSSAHKLQREVYELHGI